jgi:type IV pilus assembly protein PilM
MLDLGSLFSKGKLIAGLDIGSSSIKLAEIDESSKGTLLKSFSSLPLARGVIVDGAVVEEGALTATLKELLKASGCKRRNVALSISGNAVIIKKVNLPQMTEEELTVLIHDEATKYLPFDDLADIYYDFQITGDNPNNSSQMEVVIVAVKKDVVEGYKDAVLSAGLTPVIMDVDSFACEAVYEQNYEFEGEGEEDQTNILINIGASITNINVIKGDTSVFTRDFHIGGDSITEALAASLGVSFEEAEKAKIEGQGEDEQSKEFFREGLVVHADTICSEIERSIDFYRTTFGFEEIKGIFLSGGGALVPGLDKDLERRLGVAVEFMDPFKKIQVDKNILKGKPVELIGPVAVVSIGLALRKTVEK